MTEKDTKIDQLQKSLSTVLQEMKLMRMKVNDMEAQARTLEFSFGNRALSDVGNGSGSHTSPPHSQP